MVDTFTPAAAGTTSRGAPRTAGGPVISVRGLHKSYGQREAVAGIDLTVNEGEVFALLGPNGAGKTTTVEILEGYRERTSGEVSVLGFDPGRGERQLKERVGIVLQTTGVERYLSVAEVLQQYRGYYPAPRPLDELLELVGLTPQANTRVLKLSGGQRRRLDLAVGLAGDPVMIFLDEPTTGFDPGARRQAWEVVRNLTGLGKTVLLTTHFMDEAHVLADRLAVLVRGRIVAEGTPAEVIDQGSTATLIRFRLADAAPALPADLTATVAQDGVLEVRTETPTEVLHRLTGWALEADVELMDLSAARPTLEDTYLALTGTAEADSEAESQEAESQAVESNRRSRSRRRR